MVVVLIRAFVADNCTAHVFDVLCISVRAMLIFTGRKN